MISTTLDGVDVRANDDGNVLWMSDWARCDDLADAGFLRRVNYGPSTYGHTDFVLTTLYRVSWGANGEPEAGYAVVRTREEAEAMRDSKSWPVVTVRRIDASADDGPFVNPWDAAAMRYAR